MSFSIFAFLVMSQLVAQVAARDACKGHVDLLASAQEMVLLIAAFTVGWHLIGPFLGKLVQLLRPAVSPATPSRLRSALSTAELQRDTENSSAEATEKEDEVPGGEGPHQEPCRRHGLEAFGKWRSSDGWENVHLQARGAALKSEDSEALQAYIRSDHVDAVEAPEGPLAASQLLALARRLLKKRDVRGAEKCLEHVHQLTHGAVDPRIRKLFIVVCAQSGNMDLGTSHFQQLQSDGFKGDFAMYSAIIRGFCNVGKVEEALTYLELMLQSNLQPDALLFDTLLEGCVSCNFFQKAERILGLMKDFGIQFSNTTLAACIRLYSSRGEINRAFAIFDEWVQSNRLQPNSHVYGALIAAALRNGRPDMAISTYDAAPHSCTPNTRTYEQLVQCCLQLGLLEKAVDLLDEALGLKDSAARRTFIDPKIIEELLVLISRRKESKKLGIPLLNRLESADFELPENFDRFLNAGDDADTSGALHSPRSKRRADFDRWRSFLQ